MCLLALMIILYIFIQILEFFYIGTLISLNVIDKERFKLQYIYTPCKYNKFFVLIRFGSIIVAYELFVKDTEENAHQGIVNSLIKWMKSDEIVVMFGNSTNIKGISLIDDYETISK